MMSHPQSPVLREGMWLMTLKGVLVFVFFVCVCFSTSSSICFFLVS